MTETTMTYVVSGEDNPKTIVFVHGWPDSGSMWVQQVQSLEADYRCVCVTLPNFGASPDKSGGYGFAALVDMLSETIRRVQPSGEPVYLVTHDWGAYIGYLLEAKHPDLVDKMVAMDVGGHTQPSGLREAAMIMGYQWTLIAGWILGGLIPPLGTALSRGLGRALALSPERAAGIKSYFNYPYFQLWMDLLVPWRRKNLLGRYRPECATLYIYGCDKPVMFHSERWFQTVEETGGRCEAIEDGGHWFMESHPDQINDLIREWFPQAVVLDEP